MNKELPIGVIDSGVGGLSVLRCLRQALPEEQFIYIGDTARTPYGSRSEAEVRAFVEEILSWLDRQQIKMAVIACNTITVLGTDTLQQQHKFPLIGMSKGEELVLEASGNKKIGVMATPFTVGTRAHEKAILAKEPQAQVYLQPCPDFVPLIEREILSGPEIQQAVAKYAAPLKADGVDTVILSCTHYPFIKNIISDEFGAQVTVIDPAEATAALTKDLLISKGLLRTSQAGESIICSTADIGRVRRLAEKMLPQGNYLYRQVSLTEK